MEDFGTLRSLLQEPSRAHWVDALTRLDALGEAEPEVARERWVPYMMQRLRASRRALGAPLSRCLARTLELWDPARCQDPEVLALAERLEPHMTGEPRGFVPSVFELQVRELYERLEQPAFARAVQLPSDLLTFLRLARGRTCCETPGSDWGLGVYGHAGILEMTRSGCRVWSEECPDHPWLHLWRSGDRHDYMIPAGGQGIYYFEDAHPWMGHYGDQAFASLLLWLSEGVLGSEAPDPWDAYHEALINTPPGEPLPEPPEVPASPGAAPAETTSSAPRVRSTWEDWADD